MHLFYANYYPDYPLLAIRERNIPPVIAPIIPKASPTTILPVQPYNYNCLLI